MDTSSSDLYLALVNTANAVQRALGRVTMPSAGIPVASAFALLQIAALEKPQPSHVGRALGASTQTMTGILDLLERQGLITRQLGVPDRRSVTIFLTPAGLATCKRLREPFNDRMTDLFGALPDAAAVLENLVALQVAAEAKH
jgi:DNA-binding MarR family transcriptional regulator